MDLTPRKPAIKELIQEELTKLADEAEEEDDEDEDAEKEENPEPSGKAMKTWLQLKGHGTDIYSIMFSCRS